MWPPAGRPAMDDMNAQCERCGAVLPDGVLGGHCPRCLIQVSLTVQEETEPHARRFFDGYELLEEVARGGMGVVYRAWHPELNREVALKMLLAGPFATPAAVQRFRAESRAAASLQHPNIVAVHGIGECEGQPYFTMDFVEGRSLAELVRDGPLRPDDAARYTAQIARAVHHAHSRGILHRDLKPSNVLIDVFDQPRVTDFGLAKELTSDAGLTVTGQLLGSPGYMPPEQATPGRGPVTGASDVYSLGALLYHLVAGRAPFAAATPVETVRHVMESDPAPPRALNPALPADLETICLKCLEKEPERRYASARELAEELERFLRHEPIHARPVSPAERAWRWCRRNRSFAALAALAAGSLLLLAVGGVAAAWRIQRALRAEHTERERAAGANAELRSVNANLSATVAALELQRAESSFRLGDSSMGLAQMAAVLRRDPHHAVAAERLMSALLFRDLLLPAGPPLTHPAALYRVAYHPDGRWLATAGGDGKVRLWDLPSRTEHRVLAHPGDVWNVRFSRDGTRVLSAGAEGVVRVWQIGEDAAAQLSVRHGSPVRAIAIDEPNGRLVTGGDDGMLRLWSVPSGELLAAWPGHGGRIYAVEFSPDGGRILSGAIDGSVRSWDARAPAGEAVVSTHANWVTDLAFAPEGGRLAVAARDRTVRVLDFGTPASGAGGSVFFPDGLNVVRFHPDGQWMAGGCIDYTAHLRDVRTGLPASQALRHGDQVEGVDFSPDGLTLATAGQDGLVQFWDLRPRRCLSEPMFHGDAVRWIDVSADGERVVSASWDGSARVWRARTGVPASPPLRHLTHVHTARFDPAGRRVVTASADATAMIWDAGTGRALAGPLRHAVGLWSACFSPDGRLVATAAADGTARVWDSESGQPVTPFLRHERDVFDVRFSPDGTRLVTGSLDDTARLWEVVTGRPLGAPLRHADAVIAVEFSSDGRRVATASRDNTARIWDAISGAPVSAPMAHARTVESVCFSPDGRRVLTASMDHTARVWDAATGEPMGPPLEHGDQVWHGVFSPDGQRIATGAADGTARLWDAATGLPVSEIIRQPGGVRQVRFTPDGRWLATGTVAPDNAVRVWPVPRASAPIPEWWLELGEAVAGLKLGRQGSLEQVKTPALERIRSLLAAEPASSEFARLARWFLADPSGRPLAPDHPVDRTEYVRRRVEEGTLGALEEAVRLEPTNAVALSRLAAGVLRSSDREADRAAAASLARRALRFDSGQGTARSVLEELDRPAAPPGESRPARN